MSVAERLRLAFEELGPTFVKFGQLLASRPDLVPEEIIEELKRLHDNVQPLSFDQVQQVIEQETGVPLYSFVSEIDERPLGSASIAQAHRARLTTGEDVVIKVQRPGIAKLIEDDIQVVTFLAGLIETYVDELKVFRPLVLVDEFAKALELETNFLVEANNIRRFAVNFQSVPEVIIPEVYLDLSSERILVLEYLDGVPLSKYNPTSMPFEIDRDKVVREGLNAFYKMVFKDGLFHGDLHAGNFFLLPNNCIGLVDFGVVGRLTPKAKSTVAAMMIALATEDYDRMAEEYLELAPFNQSTQLELFARDLRELLAPYYGLSLRNVNLGKLLMSSATVAASHGVAVPSELMLFFKSVVHIESIGRTLIDDFDFLAQAIEYAGGLIKEQYGPKSIARETRSLLRDSLGFLKSLPREGRQILRKFNQPDFAIHIEVKHAAEIQRSLQHLSHLLFLSIVILSLMLSSTMIFVYDKGPIYAGMPLFSLIGYGAAGFLGFLSAFQYIRR